MKIDLHAQVTFADVHAGAVAFFHWWTGELFALLPETWRATYARWRQRSILHEQGTCWTFTLEGDEAPVFALDMALEDDAICEGVARDAPEVFTRPLDVALSCDEILVRRIEVPNAAVSRLRSTVGLQIERLSPFRAEDVGFDCRIVGRDDLERKTFVEICIVPRKTLQRFEQRLQKLGLSADWFLVEGTPFRIRSDGGAARDVSRRKLMLAASAVAALMWLGVTIFTPISRDIDAGALSDQIAALKPDAERAMALKAELETLHQPARLAAAKAAAARPIDILKTLTAVLPNSVRILELSIEGSHVALVGIAKDAPSLIAVLEKSGKFQSAHFRMPVTRRPDGNDRFELEMNVAPPIAHPARTT